VSGSLVWVSHNVTLSGAPPMAHDMKQKRYLCSLPIRLSHLSPHKRLVYLAGKVPKCDKRIGRLCSLGSVHICLRPSKRPTQNGKD
jgi:hypothetical protein